jgi:hypothetical protein
MKFNQIIDDMEKLYKISHAYNSIEVCKVLFVSGDRQKDVEESIEKLHKMYNFRCNFNVARILMGNWPPLKLKKWIDEAPEDRFY